MNYHFVDDYEKLVDSLIREYSLDEAMSRAVGGLYDKMGKIELSIIEHAGLMGGMTILDLGCGSGRLASALTSSSLDIQYTGIDVVQKLLDYAAAKSRPDFCFVKSQSLDLPIASAGLDMVCAFSLFTHLLHHETFLYMQECARVLKLGGVFVFSFLEFAQVCHWETFLATANAAKSGDIPHLNCFIERSVIELWASKAGFSVEKYIEPTCAVDANGALGQSTAILRRA